MNTEVLEFVQKQLVLAKDKLLRTVKNKRNDFFSKRDIFVKLQKYTSEFIKNDSEIRWIIMPGLRGVGKTTCLGQLYLDLISKIDNTHVLFVALDEAIELFKTNLQEIIDVYEEILGVRYEKLDFPVFLFIDEVQTDKNWAITLKILYEKTKNVFIICSGSSAISLQMNADIARRGILEKMYPLSFTEYQMIKNNIQQPFELKKNLKKIIYFSKSAKAVYTKLRLLKQDIYQYWAKVDKLEIHEYLSIGTMPFALAMKDQLLVYNAISLLLDRVISKDIAELGKFDFATLSTIKRLLFVLAESEAISSHKLEQILGLSRITITSMLDVLEKAELLIKISAYGNNISQVKKPAKYLFMSPAIRMSLLSVAGMDGTFLSRRGKLLEDLIVSYYYRDFIASGVGSISYDSTEKSADFILKLANLKQLALEIGSGNKDLNQVINTMKRIKCDYGLIFAQNELFYDEKYNIATIPLDYILLM